MQLREQSFGVFRGRFFDLFHREIGVDFGELFGDVRDEGRLVAFATVRDRRKVWAIGLDEYAVQRRLFGDLSKHGCIVECQNTGERKIESQIQGILREPRVTREAMEDPADL